MNQKLYDLCVVGGGPAGSILARMLAKQNWEILLLEANGMPKRKICGEYLCPRGKQILEEMGMDFLFKKMRSIHGMTLYSPNGTKVETDFPSALAGLSLRRDLFDEALLQEAKAAGVHTQRGKRVENIIESGGVWRISTNAETFSAKILIGADGRQSLVSKALKNDMPPFSDKVALHINLPTEAPTGNKGEMHILGNGSYVGLNPTGEDEWNLSLVCDATEVKKSGDPKLALVSSLKESASLSSRFLPFPENVPVKVTYPISHGVKKIFGKNWALVGDAAGFVDPLTGEGIYQAIFSAKILGDELAALPLGADVSPALASYAAAYKDSFFAKRKLNFFFQRLIRFNFACDWVGSFLSKRKAKADIFIGVVGNLISPLRGFIQIIF